MTMDRFTSDFDRIFGEQLYRHRAENLTDLIAEKSVESGKQLSAAANRFAAPDKSEASPTRKTITAEGESHG